MAKKATFSAMILLAIIARAQISDRPTFWVRHLTAEGIVNQEYFRDELVVQYKASVSSPFMVKGAVAQAIRASTVTDLQSVVKPDIVDAFQSDPEFLRMYQAQGLDKFYRISFRGSVSQLHDLYATLVQDPAIQSAEYSPVMKQLAEKPNDLLFSEQWALQNIGQRLNTNLGTTRPPEYIDAKKGADISWLRALDEMGSAPSGNVYTLVEDTGCDIKHEDFDGSKNFFNYSLVNQNTDDVTDKFGHGTHVGGIIWAKTNNVFGIAGVADFTRWGCIQVLDGTGSGTVGNVNSGIVLAARKAQELKKSDPLFAGLILNLSLGAFGRYPSMQAAVKLAHDSGVIVVVAAGNSAMNIDRVPFSPASFDYVIAVAASDPLDRHAGFSNWGPRKTIVHAPGAHIVSTVPRFSADPVERAKERDRMINDIGYMSASGTSMAAPQISGAVAMILRKHPGLTRDQVLVRLLNADKTDYLYRLSFRDYIPSELSRAAGRLNLYKILETDNLAPSRPWVAFKQAGHTTAVINLTSGDDGFSGKMFGFRVFYSTMPFSLADTIRLLEGRGRPDLKMVEVLPYTGPVIGQNEVSYLLKDAAAEINAPLNENQWYYVAFQANDNVGNLSPLSEVWYFATKKSALLRAANFDSGREGLAKDGPIADEIVKYHGINKALWHLTDKFIGRGNFAWYAGIDEQFNYRANDDFVGVSDSEMIFGPIDLRYVSGSVSIKFDKFLWMASPGGFEFDLAEIRVAEVGDGTKPVAPPRIVAEFLKNNKSFAFEKYPLDLSEYAGKIIELRFRFFTNGSSVGIGFFLDNLEIRVDEIERHPPHRNRSHR